MREGKAKGVAFGTGVAILGAVALFALLDEARPLPPAQETAAVDVDRGTVQVPDSIIQAGRTVYDEVNCAACHSIAGVGSPRSPLDVVGERLTAEQLRLWVVDPQAIQPGVRKPAFDDLPEPEVDALVAYLQTLTTGSANQATPGRD